jgi:hypothetical protein
MSDGGSRTGRGELKGERYKRVCVREKERLIGFCAQAANAPVRGTQKISVLFAKDDEDNTGNEDSDDDNYKSDCAAKRR